MLWWYLLFGLWMIEIFWARRYWKGSSPSCCSIIRLYMTCLNLFEGKLKKYRIFIPFLHLWSHIYHNIFISCDLFILFIIFQIIWGLISRRLANVWTNYKCSDSCRAVPWSITVLPGWLIASNRLYIRTSFHSLSWVYQLSIQLLSHLLHQLLVHDD